MDDFAKLPSSERREIIAEVSVSAGLDFTIVEKDFWICWVLQLLFSLPPGHAPMVFKGGTSLSKAYRLIQRFSEDCNVVTPTEFYLQRGVADPAVARSRTQQLERMKKLDDACQTYVGSELAPVLEQQVEDRLGRHKTWDILIDPEDRYGHSVLFRYPASASDTQHPYIRGRVKIELGWRSAIVPSEACTFRSYVADRFPTLMQQPDVTCVVLSPARTFWEKVTALHAESFRDEVPHFFSRHYSDVAAVLQTPLGTTAARDLAMLEDVRQFKQRYYPAAWARYDLAVPGTLALVPSDTKLRALASDYREMGMMFFQPPPPFDHVVEQLRILQTRINTSP